MSINISAAVDALIDPLTLPSSNPVLPAEQGAAIAASLARRSGGKKRQEFRDIVEREKAEVARRIAHFEAERARAERERRIRQHRRDNIGAMLKVAQATFGLVSQTETQEA